MLGGRDWPRHCDARVAANPFRNVRRLVGRFFGGPGTTLWSIHVFHPECAVLGRRALPGIHRFAARVHLKRNPGAIGSKACVEEVISVVQQFRGSEGERVVTEIGIQDQLRRPSGLVKAEYLAAAVGIRIGGAPEVAVVENGQRSVLFELGIVLVGKPGVRIR